MKKIFALVILLGLLFIVGCNDVKEDDNEAGLAVSEPIVEEIIHQEETDDMSSESAFANREYEIRIFEDDFSPNMIEVNRGDSVTLHVTNTRCSDEDCSGKMRFYVEDYAEEIIPEGTTGILQFRAYQAGTFDFGDESRSESKGIFKVY